MIWQGRNKFRGNVGRLQSSDGENANPDYAKDKFPSPIRDVAAIGRTHGLWVDGLRVRQPG